MNFSVELLCIAVLECNQKFGERVRSGNVSAFVPEADVGSICGTPQQRSMYEIVVFISLSAVRSTAFRRSGIRNSSVNTAQ
jgi:hypothetical protein